MSVPARKMEAGEFCGGKKKLQVFSFQLTEEEVGLLMEEDGALSKIRDLAVISAEGTGRWMQHPESNRRHLRQEMKGHLSDSQGRQGKSFPVSHRHPESDTGSREAGRSHQILVCDLGQFKEKL